MTSTARTRPPLVVLLCAVSVGALAPAPLRAQQLHAGATDRVALNVPSDLVVTGLGAAGTLLPEIFARQLVPDACRLCDGSPAAPSVNRLDGFFHDALTGAIVSRGTSDKLSTVTAFALAPAAALTAAFVATGPHATPGAGLRAAVIVVESTAVAGALAQSIKLIAARPRPFVRYGHADASGGYDASATDARLSFPSGHTTIAAALTVSAATTATLEESRAAPWLWAAAGAATVSTAALRMMAEKHYLTDVLVGAAIGTGCGVAIPLLHRRGGVLAESAARTSVSAPRGGFAFSYSGAF